jgi:hypothetical protein
MRTVSVLLATFTLILMGCNPPGLVNRAAAEDYSASVAVEVAKLSLEEGSAPVSPDNKVPRAKCRECNGTGKVRSGDGLFSYDCTACYAVSAIQAASYSPNACGCGTDCRCTKELAALRDYRDRMEAWLASKGYRPSNSAAADQRANGSCAGGQCSVSSGGYRSPPRRGWFGRRR